VYKRKAQAFLDLAKSEYPGLESQLNPEKPRRGAFNISVTLDNGDSLDLWDGKSKGPPRKLKFPDNEELLASLRKKLEN